MIDTLRVFSRHDVEEAIKIYGETNTPFMKIVGSIDSIIIKPKESIDDPATHIQISEKLDIKYFVGDLTTEKSQQLLSLYNKRFDKYRPKFSIGFKCDNCTKDFDNQVPLDIIFFLKSK
jgi:hypothetical protein